MRRKKDKSFKTPYGTQEPSEMEPSDHGLEHLRQTEAESPTPKEAQEGAGKEGGRGNLSEQFHRSKTGETDG